MKKPFSGAFPITQVFGVNPKDYAKFGLKGHNGIDYGLPCETKLISPIAGKVTEVANDPDGYGLYLKIENSTESCLLAHLIKQDVALGQVVDEGQHLGWSGTSGNSTGCHLHFGYYRTPRNKANGYNGYIDPTPYFQESVIINPEPVLVPSMNDQTKIAASLLGVSEDLEIQAIRGLLKDGQIAREDLENCKRENEDFKSINTLQATRLDELSQQLNACLTSPVNASKTFQTTLGKYLYRLAELFG
jgi:murein DD-endopeptidase MepM/ murein hydrolase activator NlpD